MNSRERTLVITLALVALLMVVYFIWSSASSALASRHAALTNLQSDVKEQDRILREATRATRTLADLKKRSLPEDREQAQAAYGGWLLNLVDRLEFLDPSVQVADRRVGGTFYQQSRFEVDAQASLDQLTDFLAEFYSAGDLHRIQQLTITPRSDSRQLDLFIVIEAISLPGTQRTTVGDIPSPRLAKADVPAIEETILNRNMFFPANEPPKIESIGNQRVVRGTPMRLTVKATDADSWDTLSFSLCGEPPEGVKIEPQKSGEAVVTWLPRENGDYSIDLEVHDSGLPRQTKTASFKVTVVDPPPPDDGRRRMIGFDDATQTFLVATVGIGEKREAWFSVRTTGQMLKLSPGAQFEVGSILGELTTVGEKLVEIKTPDGVVRVRVGQSLSEALALSPPDRQAELRP